MKRRASHTRGGMRKKVCHRASSVDTRFREDDNEKIIYFTDDSIINLHGVSRAVVDSFNTLHVSFCDGRVSVVELSSREDAQYIIRILEHFHVKVEVPHVVSKQLTPSYIS